MLEVIKMSREKYTIERNVQMLIYLMKAKGIKKIIISPGTTNVTFAYSVQQDGFFELYSAADERSAAYMACGISAQTGEPVALSCTGATASRNYYPGLTEAYYRQLPILAITSTQPRDRTMNLSPQFIDRTQVAKDVVKDSYYSPSVHCIEDELNNVVILNKAIDELTHGNPGPVHINLETEYKTDYSIKQLPPCRVITRYTKENVLPEIEKGKRVAIYVGAHTKWTDKLTDAVDSFCRTNNAIVLCDWTSNYQGKYGVYASLLTYQELNAKWIDYDLVIDIGRVSGAYMRIRPKSVWRVSISGEYEDRFRRLEKVFEMDELTFFSYYSKTILRTGTVQAYDAISKDYDRVYQKIKDLPFSNIYASYRITQLLPKDSIVHLGILNSLRSWNFFSPKNHKVLGFSNTGGFGIDGCVSSLIGSSIVCPNTLHFGVVGDLAFFYDMNSIGNRHVGNNLRLLIVSNGCGTEFRNYDHLAYRFGKETEPYIAASGHYGNMSKELIKNYAMNLGYKYISAESATEFDNVVGEFVDLEYSEKSIIFEIFVTPEDESGALKRIRQLNGTLYRQIEVSDQSSETITEQVHNGELVEFVFNCEYDSVCWYYKQKNSKTWKPFVNGDCRTLRKKIDTNYSDITVLAKYGDVGNMVFVSSKVSLVLGG